MLADGLFGDDRDSNDWHGVPADGLFGDDFDRDDTEVMTVTAIREIITGAIITDADTN